MKTLCLLLASTCVAAQLARADVFLDQEQALKLAFPRADAIEKQLLALTPQERAQIEAKNGVGNAPRVYKYWIGRRGAAVDGYAVIDDVLGKSQPITYMLVVDASLKVRAVEILAYRESHGGEVRQADWLQQFARKGVDSPLRVGSDIRNIAGATISCRSITDGVRTQLACLSVVVKHPAPPAEDARIAPASDAARAPNAAAPASDATAGTLAPRAAPSAGADDVLVQRARLLMGTTLAIAVHANGESSATSAIDAAFGEVARLEQILSTWIDESEVSRLNRGAGGDFVAISPELYELLERSVEASKRYAGAFDVSVGPLIELWKRAAQQGSTPTPTETARARSQVGSEVIELDHDRKRARLSRPGARLDFGGIGKGFALDRAARVLHEHGVECALLDFGGQILALDAPPGATGWTVGVRDPAAPATIGSTLSIAHASVSSTGDYERGVELGGRRYSHVFDPASGLPVDGMLGVTVIAPSATEAEVLSKVLYVQGAERGSHLAIEQGLCALLVAADGRVTRTPGYRALAIDPAGVQTEHASAPAQTEHASAPAQTEPAALTEAHR